MMTPDAQSCPLADNMILAALSFQLEKKAPVEKKSTALEKKDLLTKAGAEYARAFCASAQSLLPNWQHERIHRRARASAGGKGKSRSRARATDASKAKLLEEADGLKARLAEIEAEVAKAADLTDRAMTLVAAALEAQGPDASQQIDLPPEWLPAFQAQQLVRGMDDHLEGTTLTVDEARQKASAHLAHHPMAYANSHTEGQPRMPGLDLDLGSGLAREHGYLGVDLYPYDHGTVLHDLDLGIPFDTGQARQVRWVNTPELAKRRGGADAVMADIARVLAIGGRLTYEGPEELLAGLKMPGLKLAERYAPGPDEKTTINRIIFEREDMAAPLVHGADPRHLGASEASLGLADQMMLAALNSAPARLAMANLLRKTKVKVAPNDKAHVLKADGHKQVVYGVVLAPNEIDSQGDYMEATEIEFSAHHFMQTSRTVGANHEEMIEAVPVESYIAPQELTFNGQNGPQKVPKGAWVMAVKINDADHWAKVLSGQYTGFSIGGVGLLEERARDTLSDTVSEAGAIS